MTSACVYIECPITGMILAVSRKDDPNAFGLPGGKLLEGESERAGAWRELFEETGLYLNANHFEEIFRREGGVTFGLPDDGWFHSLKMINKPRKGETGRVAWITPAQLVAGPFGDYNRLLLVAVGRNQCDGCRAGKPTTVNGNHVMGGGEYLDLMACQAGRY